MLFYKANHSKQRICVIDSSLPKTSNLWLCKVKKCMKILNGARGSKVDEPLAFQRNYQVEWVAPRVNLRELALLRFIQGKTERELAQYFGRSKTAIHELLARMLKNDFSHANLTKAEKEKINGALG